MLTESINILLIIIVVPQDVPNSLGLQPTHYSLKPWLRHARAVWGTHAPSKYLFAEHWYFFF